MYPSYTSHDGYTFDDRGAWAQYEIDSQENAWCFAPTYGGYKEEDSYSEPPNKHKDYYTPTFTRKTDTKILDKIYWRDNLGFKDER